MDSMNLLKLKIEKSALPKTTVELKRNDILKHSDTVDTNLYLIKSGSLRVYNVINGVEHCLYFGFKGSAITATDSFFGEKTSNYIIQAIKRSKVEVVSKEDFMQFINSEKENLLLWQNILVEIIQHHIQRAHDLFEISSEERFNRLIQRAPYLFQEIPHKYIASYLRMSPETLSRLQKS